MTPPRVSILIPNFNNGRASSVSGATDLLGDLLESLRVTLADDPTPVEIIALDDGSTDDSLDTLRDWAGKTWGDFGSWRAEQAFLTLIERPHRGVLAAVANEMVAASSGDVLVRLDGDIVVETPRWAEALVRLFDDGPKDLGVVGPKQIGLDGRIHSFGDWLLHPKGYHHIAMGTARDSPAVSRAVECDHVMGCFYCCRRAVHEDVGGYDETILRGQTVDFGVMARRNGWRCWAVPHIEFVHRHGLRKARDTKADTSGGIAETLATFEAKWGFDRLTPDLDVVAKRYAGTGLLWNAAVFGGGRLGAAQATTAEPAAVDVKQTRWAGYAKDEATRRAADARVSVVQQVAEQVKLAGDATVVQLGSGDGLVAHLLAQAGKDAGRRVVGVEADAALVAVARRCTEAQDYGSGSIAFEHEPTRRAVPEAARGAGLTVAFDEVERHPNPAGWLRAVAAACEPGAWLVLTATPGGAPGGAGGEPWTAGQLCAFVQHVGGWVPMTDPRSQPAGGPVVVVARRG